MSIEIADVLQSNRKGTAKMKMDTKGIHPHRVRTQDMTGDDVAQDVEFCDSNNRVVGTIRLKENPDSSFDGEFLNWQDIFEEEDARPLLQAAVDFYADQRDASEFGWINETPSEASPEAFYELSMVNQSDYAEDQYVKLTRDEFIELKRHLAIKRGYGYRVVESSGPATEES
jgi:hypothetical protein